MAFYDYLENREPVFYFLWSFPNCAANSRYDSSNVTLLKSSSLGQHTNHAFGMEGIRRKRKDMKGTNRKKRKN